MGMELCVLGLGYMGLPTASLFAKNGYSVTGVDIDSKKIESLKKGIIYFDEPGLTDLAKSALNSGNLKVSTEIIASDIFIISVPTPLNKENSKSDLQYVESASNMIKSVLKKGDLIILESTVPPQTCEKTVIPILEQTGLKAGEDFLLSHCPERALPGNTLHEIINNDRIIGGINTKSSEKTKEVYKSFCKGEIFLTNSTTAEAVKLMENTFRDVNIALANEFLKICNTYQINTWEAIKLANKNPRVNVHYPGPGVGGHCIAVDPYFLTENSNYNSDLINTARKINISMPKYVMNIVDNELKEIKDPTITIIGIAYKPDVDDSRESPAFNIIKIAKEKGYNVKITDPYVKLSNHEVLDLNNALENSDCAIIVTDHKDYYNLTKKDMENMRQKVIIDTRNCIKNQNFENFKIINIGYKK